MSASSLQNSTSSKAPAPAANPRGQFTPADDMLDEIDAMEAQGIEITETALISRLHLNGHQQAKMVLEAHLARCKRPAVVEAEDCIIKPSINENALVAVPKTLEDYEAIIREGVKAAFRVGEALLQIREKRLYEGTHSTFDAYCHDRFKIERSQAYRWMDAARVLTNLSPIGDIPMPTSEAQVRPLARLEPEQQVRAWRHACSSSLGTPIKAKQVQASVELILPLGQDRCGHGFNLTARQKAFQFCR